MRSERPGAPRFRDATVADLPAIVRLYADDDLGATREVVTDPVDDAYLDAFRLVESDPRTRLVVAEDEGEVVATLQLSVLPHLVLHGAQRAQIEAVRVRADRRGSGLGEQLLRWAVDQARAQGCRLVQLTTNGSRADARRFYERLGFEASHVGLKLVLD